MATREEILAALEEQKALVSRLVSSTPTDGWSAGAHENGWNARELLSHVATTSRVGGFVMAMANVPATSIPATFDQDDFNAEQVAIRASKSVQEVADEIRGNLDSDITAIRKAPDELLARHYKAPWETDGTVAEVILSSVREHNGTHLSELRAALS
jgi:Mycothiol maleylpyruvate isomerase N-terminal domain